MADPDHPQEYSERPPDASPSRPTEGSSPPPNASMEGDITSTLFKVLKQAIGDERVDRRMSREAREAALRAKAGRLQTENESIEASRDEAGQKASQMMESAWIGLGLGIFAIIAAVAAGVWFWGGQGASGAAAITSLMGPPADSLPAGIGGISNPLPSSPGSDGETVAPASPGSSTCTLSFAELPSQGEVPASGPFTFDWTDVPGAAEYSLRVQQPSGAGAPWVVTEMGTSKTLYMENFPVAGEYEISASALSARGEALCTATIRFKKNAAEFGDDKGSNEDGAATCFDPNKTGKCQ